MFDKRFAKRVSLAGIFNGIVQCTFGQTQRQRGDRWPGHVKITHGDGESLPLFSQKIFLRNRYILQNHLCRIASAKAALVFNSADADARRVTLHDKKGKLLFRGLCQHGV